MAVIALLGLIWLQLGGVESVERMARRGYYLVKDALVSTREEPMPGRSGFEFDNTADIERLAKQPPNK